LQPVTPLFIVADLADSSVYTTHKNQLILAKQLIEHGANVNAVSSDGATPLHNACKAGMVTNLDFVQLLLEEGADPNFQMPSGLTPLMFTTADAPGAAKFLLNWPTTDVNITTHDHAAFLHFVQMNIEKYSYEIALNPNIPDRVQQQLLLQQWRDVEEMAVEKGAHDLGLAAFE
jgi:fructose-1-phosphate kinase PfkB-like protein